MVGGQMVGGQMVGGLIEGCQTGGVWEDIIMVCRKTDSGGQTDGGWLDSGWSDGWWVVRQMVGGQIDGGWSYRQRVDRHAVKW